MHRISTVSAARNVMLRRWNSCCPGASSRRRWSLTTWRTCSSSTVRGMLTSLAGSRACTAGDYRGSCEPATGYASVCLGDSILLAASPVNKLSVLYWVFNTWPFISNLLYCPYCLLLSFLVVDMSTWDMLLLYHIPLYHRWDNCIFVVMYVCIYSTYQDWPWS